MKPKLSREEVAAKWLEFASDLGAHMGRAIRLDGKKDYYVRLMLREIDAAKPRSKRKQ